MTTSRTTDTAVIAVSGTTSPTVTVPTNTTLLGLITPAGMTGTALTFLVEARSSGTPVSLKPNNVAYSITIDANSGYYPVETKHFEGVTQVRVVSNAVEAAERSITLVFGRTE